MVHLRVRRSRLVALVLLAQLDGRVQDGAQKADGQAGDVPQAWDHSLEEKEAATLRKLLCFVY